MKAKTYRQMRQARRRLRTLGPMCRPCAKLTCPCMAAPGDVYCAGHSERGEAINHVELARRELAGACDRLGGPLPEPLPFEVTP